MINKDILQKTVARLVQKPKGILAIDESLATCNSRFEKLGVPTTLEKRQEYRELLITSPEIEKYISGYILFDETIRQSTRDGKSFVSVMNQKGLDIGIKVDMGTKDLDGFKGDKFTDGLDGLDARLKEYKSMGATFAKWRAVYAISDTTPSEEAMKINAKIFAQYANLCQENGIVPIVEPEVLFDGNHTIEKCYEVTAKNLDIVFTELKNAGVFLGGVILKTSMVLNGKDLSHSKPEVVAEMTVKCLKEHIPADIGGVVFLSGGQSDIEATENLNAMHKNGDLPWPLTFSYGRGIQNEALKSWAQYPADFLTAERLLLEAAEKNSKASVGEYK